VKAFLQSTFQDTWAGRYASLAAAVAKRKVLEETSRVHLKRGLHEPDRTKVADTGQKPKGYGK
jgi:hypothetical protein